MGEQSPDTEPRPDGQMACSMASVLIRRVRSSLGEAAVLQLIERSGVPYDATYLEDLGNWIPYEHAGGLMEAAVELTGDEDLVRRAGEDTVRQHAGTAVATLLRSLGSPQAVFEQLTLAATKFSTVIDMAPVEVAPGRAVVRAKAKPGYARHRRHCEYTQRMLSQPPALFGLPAARVVETSCELQGDDHCLYTVTWDAESAERATDPGELVAALEQQVAAMTDRLENMYATARDLIALDDVDAAVTRITERAATAVRAPSYPTRGACRARQRAARSPSRLHRCRGRERDAGAARRRQRRVASGLVVDVASATRHYGRLMAASPDGAFFPHERDLLDVYARYAAAVLDTATALDAARRRHEEAQALLGLAQSVATANTSQDVAERLAGAVPAVVDCDRAFVFLWDEVEQALVHHASGGDPGPSGDIARQLRITPADTPRLDELRASPTPDPLFFDTHPEDSFIEATMRATGALALVVVPIVANERFYGVMNVSVTERPERLAPSPALLDTLAGVVAQAATALDNARLIETMAHQARHDNLTGLLGHRAFHEAIADGLSERDPEAFTLAMIDIETSSRSATRTAIRSATRRSGSWPRLFTAPCARTTACSA